MNEVKLKRRDARNLVSALQYCKRVDIPATFRYAIKRNLDSLQSDFESTNEAFLDPEGKPKDEAGFATHLNEEITVKLHLEALPEIKDPQTNLTHEQRAMNEQLIVEYLFPIIKEEEAASNIIRI